MPSFDIRYSIFDIRFLKVSFSIKLAAFQAGGLVYMKLVLYISKFGVGSILGHFGFVGWVEPTPGFVGFRCTQPNLHFAGDIAKCETQQIDSNKFSCNHQSAAMVASKMGDCLLQRAGMKALLPINYGLDSNHFSRWNKLWRQILQ